MKKKEIYVFIDIKDSIVLKGDIINRSKRIYGICVYFIELKYRSIGDCIQTSNLTKYRYVLSTFWA